ncbi:MAG: hypothetical protein ACYTGZ_04445 [Planctomycetota bacterium]|jgi:hypothetical protein
MASSALRVGLIFLLAAACVGAIVFVFLSLDEFGRRTQDDEREWEAEFRRSRRADERRRAATLPEPPPETDSGKRAEADDSARTEEEEVEERPDEVALGELAQLTLELLRPKEDEERAIVVYVSDDSGESMPDVLVVVRDRGELIFRARTDEEGVAEFQPYEDEEGPFRIDAIAPYYSPGYEEEVKPGADVRLVLDVQPWIEGQVIAPVRGQGLVTLYTERGKRETTIAADGSFEFHGLDPGPVTVQADVPPYGSDMQEFNLAAGTRQWVRLRVRLRKRVRIFGDILNWPKEGDSKVWINGARVAVERNGRYTFGKGVFGKMNEIVIDAHKRALFFEYFEVKGRKKSKYDFRLQSESHISGIVSDAKNRAVVAEAEVRVGLDANDPTNDAEALRFPIHLVPVVYSDDKGRFTIDRLIPGNNYVVSIVKHPHGQYLGKFTARTLGVQRMMLPTGPFLFGKLQGLGGVPRNSKVTARRLLEEPDDMKFNVALWDRAESGRDVKGFYGLSGLLPGVYLVRAEAAGYGSMETVVDLTDSFEGRLDLRIRKGQADRVEDSELLQRLPPVVVDAEDVPEEKRGDFTFLTVDTTRAADKVPFPGVHVRFFENDMEFTAPMSYSEAKFEIVGLPEATYRAVLTHGLLDKPIVVDGIQLRRGEPYTVQLEE